MLWERSPEAAGCHSLVGWLQLVGEAYFKLLLLKLLLLPPADACY